MGLSEILLKVLIFLEGHIPYLPPRLRHPSPHHATFIKEVNMLVPEGHRLFLSTVVVSEVSVLEPQQLSYRDQEQHCQLWSFRRQGEIKHTAHRHPKTPLGAVPLPCLLPSTGALFHQTPGKMRPIRFLPGDPQITGDPFPGPVLLQRSGKKGDS